MLGRSFSVNGKEVSYETGIKSDIVNNDIQFGQSDTSIISSLVKIRRELDAFEKAETKKHLRLLSKSRITRVNVFDETMSTSNKITLNNSSEVGNNNMKKENFCESGISQVVNQKSFKRLQVGKIIVSEDLNSNASKSENKINAFDSNNFGTTDGKQQNNIVVLGSSLKCLHDKSNGSKSHVANPSTLKNQYFRYSPAKQSHDKSPQKSNRKTSRSEQCTRIQTKRFKEGDRPKFGNFSSFDESETILVDEQSTGLSQDYESGTAQVTYLNYDTDFPPRMSESRSFTCATPLILCVSHIPSKEKQDLSRGDEALPHQLLMELKYKNANQNASDIHSKACLSSSSRPRKPISRQKKSVNMGDFNKGANASRCIQSQRMPKTVTLSSSHRNTSIPRIQKRPIFAPESLIHVSNRPPIKPSYVAKAKGFATKHRVNSNISCQKNLMDTSQMKQNIFGEWVVNKSRSKFREQNCFKDKHQLSIRKVTGKSSVINDKSINNTGENNLSQSSRGILLNPKRGSVKKSSVKENSSSSQFQPRVSTKSYSNYKNTSEALNNESVESKIIDKSSRKVCKISEPKKQESELKLSELMRRTNVLPLRKLSPKSQCKKMSNISKGSLHSLDRCCTKAFEGKNSKPLDDPHIQDEPTEKLGIRCKLTQPGFKRIKQNKTSSGNTCILSSSECCQTSGERKHQCGDSFKWPSVNKHRLCDYTSRLNHDMKCTSSRCVSRLSNYLDKSKGDRTETQLEEISARRRHVLRDAASDGYVLVPCNSPRCLKSPYFDQRSIILPGGDRVSNWTPRAANISPRTYIPSIGGRIDIPRTRSIQSSLRRTKNSLHEMDDLLLA